MKAKDFGMLKGGAKLRISVIASALICLLSARAGATSDVVAQREVREAIAKIQNGESLTARTDAAEHLAELTRRMDPNKLDDTTLAELISLLDTSEDSVRGWVAGALGNLGTRAKAAVPKLLHLLPEVDCLRGSLTSAPVVRLALVRMGEMPPAQACGTEHKRGL